MTRQADEIFENAHGKQKDFPKHLEAPFEDCDEQFFDWFILYENLCGMTKRPQEFEGYILVKKNRRASRTSPGGPCLAFFRADVQLGQINQYKLDQAEVVVQRCHDIGGWKIELSDSYSGNALQKLKTFFLKEKISENVGARGITAV